MNIICLGGSYTGRGLASRFAGQHQVFFLTRDVEEMRRQGYRAVQKGGLDRVLAVHKIGLVLDTIPPVEAGNGMLEPPYRKEVERVLAVNPEASLVHLSSTSVYPMLFKAQDNNEEELPTLDERTSAEPDTQRGVERLRLEKVVTALFSKTRVLRCGGIYGPRRCIAVRFRAGDFRRAEAGNLMVSRIHVHDLARLITAYGALPAHSAPRVVNAVDERSSSNRETFTYLEEVLGVTIPGDWREGSPQGRRVTSLYSKSLLGGQYAYPTYREGFARCLAKE